MTEPTDHRADARGALDQALDVLVQTDRLTFAEEGILSALVGIGHALLAGLLEPAIWAESIAGSGPDIHNPPTAPTPSDEFRRFS